MTSIKYILPALLPLAVGMNAAAATPPRHMVVTVVNKHFSPAQPVANVRVSLSYFDGSAEITDARDRTNRRGQTELLVSADPDEQGDLRIDVSDADALVIYQPAEGLIRAIPATLDLVLLPKGSPALLEPAKIEAMLDRLSRLSLENQHLELTVSKLEKQRPDFDKALRDWSARNGLPYDEVDHRVKAWANEVLSHREQASLIRRAEAELGLRHFENAAKLHAAAANSSRAALRLEQKEYLEHTRQKLREVVRQLNQAAAEFQFAGDFKQATRTAEDARDDAEAEHKRYPEDTPLRDIWLSASIITEATRWQEGAQPIESLSGSSTHSLQLLSEVASNCRALIGQMNEAREPDKLALAEMFLVGALLFQSEISPSAEAAKLRAQAVAVSRSAVRHFPKNQDSEMWSNFQLMLFTAEAAQVIRGLTDGSIDVGNASAMRNGINTLSESIAALGAELEPLDKTKHAKEWGTIKTWIGEFLLGQGLFAMAPNSGAEAVVFFERAESSERAALAVLTRDKYPREWARAEGSLAEILSREAQLKSGSGSLELSLQAESAYRAALEIRNKRDDPTAWANSQDQLAALLQTRAMRMTQPESIALLRESAALKREEADVITKTGFPQRWARLQVGLGEALAMLGVRLTGSASAAVLSEAAQAYSDALEVFTEGEYPRRWASTKSLLGTLLTAEALVSVENSRELLRAAAAAEKEALGVFTRQAFPNEWAVAQSNLGWALAVMSSREHTGAAQMRAQAVDAYRASLQILTKDVYPDLWVNAQGRLAEILAIEGRVALSGASGYLSEAASRYVEILEMNPNHTGALAALSVLYHDDLLDFSQAWEITKRLAAAAPSDPNRLNLAEAALTVSRFSDCIESIGTTTQSGIVPALLPARQVLLFACQWGAKTRAAARETATTIQVLGNGVLLGGWGVGGDLKYIDSAQEFSAEKALWIRLFTALGKGDGTSLADVSRELQATIEK